jgi:uncharacterized Ntn-hydrolase superfamily protein
MLHRPNVSRPGLVPSTFSIAACDLSGGDWGVAVASKFPAVGSVVPWARAGVGAVATQAWANVDYGPEGLALLADGRSAEEIVTALTEADEGRDQRQLGVIDAQGRAATFTGSECMPWAGGTAGDGYACQGNILTGPDVPEAMAEAFATAAGDLVDRLLAALEAGDAAGGDRRGKQSAAILVVRDGGGYDRRGDHYVDLRVDDHPEPVTELRRIFTVFDETYLVRNDPLLTATGALVSEIQHRLRSAGYLEGSVTGTYDDDTRAAMQAFAGRFNLEGRLRSDDLLSEALVRELRDVTPDLS